MSKNIQTAQPVPNLMYIPFSLAARSFSFLSLLVSSSSASRFLLARSRSSLSLLKLTLTSMLFPDANTSLEGCGDRLSRLRFFCFSPAVRLSPLRLLSLRFFWLSLGRMTVRLRPLTWLSIRRGGVQDGVKCLGSGVREGDNDGVQP